VKGKQRRATKAAATCRTSKEITWTNLLGGLTINKEGIVTDIQCNHGVIIPPTVHPVYAFMHTFVNEMSSKTSATEFTRLVFEKHPRVIENAVNRKLARDLVLAIGSNFLITEDETSGSRPLAVSIMILESYEGDFDSAYLKMLPLMRDINCGGDRDTLRFFSKRLPCLCLNHKYIKSKCQVKIGKCSCCSQTFERATLRLCG